MPTLDGAVVLITGANGGIGTEFVREALDRGARTVDATPVSAASAIVDGLQRRQARVMHPSRSKPMSALRGVVGFALDGRLVKDRRTLDILARLDNR